MRNQVLMAGVAAPMPAAKGGDGDADDDNEVAYAARARKNKKRKGGDGGAILSKRHDSAGKGKEWIQKKKELHRKRGVEGVPHDSKYTGRKRKACFQSMARRWGVCATRAMRKEPKQR